MSAFQDAMGMGQEGRSNVHNESSRKNRRWIKVLVAVLGLIVLLGILSFSFVINHPHRHSFTRVRSEMADIKVAIGHYRTEYDSFPTGGSFSNKDAEIRSEGPVLAALLGKHEELNVKKIKFLDVPMARDGRRGLILKEDKWRLVDRWGELYYVVMDVNRDNRIANPEALPGNLSTTIPESLNAIVILYSAGPDRDPKTWEDNVRSWR